MAELDFSGNFVFGLKWPKTAPRRAPMGHGMHQWYLSLINGTKMASDRKIFFKSKVDLLVLAGTGLINSIFCGFFYKNFSI